MRMITSLKKNISAKAEKKNKRLVTLHEGVDRGYAFLYAFLTRDLCRKFFRWPVYRTIGDRLAGVINSRMLYQLS